MTFALPRVLILLFFISCASSYKETSGKIRQLVTENKHQEAIELLQKSSLKDEANSRLLYIIELGLLEHYRGNYDASITHLSEAREILDALYTTRVSNKLKAFVTSDSADLFYGEKYEASLIHFYLALNHYMKADQEVDQTKRRISLEQARADILAWDSFLTEMKNERLGQALFKEDLLAKTFGALVHESQGNAKDDQIALQLYKDAHVVLFRNYNLFPTFNESYEVFKENFEKLPGLSEQEVAGKYVLATKHSPALKDFLNTKILYLTKKVNPQDLKTQIASLKPSKEILDQLQRPTSQITFLIQDGLITEKMAKKYEIPLQLGVYSTFALGLGVAPLITYELPYTEPSSTLELARLQAIDKDGVLKGEAPLSVIAPLGELAQQAINEHSRAVAVKTGARLVTKHIAAIAAAQITYQSIAKENPSIAWLTATLGHSAAIAAINESEKADVRFWSTLPSNIRMGNLSLSEGTYRFRAVFGDPQASDYRVLELGEQVVRKGSLKFVLHNRSQSSVSRSVASAGCRKDTDCAPGKVCATVRGEYPGSCADGGVVSPKAHKASSTSKHHECRKNSDCGKGKVCATVRGEYPGSCADKGVN
jgi:hypothetical protein